MGMEMRLATSRPRRAAELPREVQSLLWREREVATVVYELGAATAVEVLPRLSAPLANASVRSMMNRLVKKGILMRWRAGSAFVYMPAITMTDSRTLALTRFADDYFAGSIQLAASAMKDLVEQA